MDFAIVLESLIKKFKTQNIDFAMIGAFAVGSAGYIRVTDDLDFIVPLSDSKKIHDIMVNLDYKSIQFTNEFATYASDIEIFGRVDFLFAHREISSKMLKRAKEKPLFGGKMTVKVLDPEDIIGLKIQSIVNNPDRTVKDSIDIENIIKINRDSLDMGQIREYFKLFNREDDLNKILERIKYAYWKRKRRNARRCI